MRVRWIYPEGNYRHLLTKKGIPEDQAKALEEKTRKSLGERYDQATKAVREDLIKTGPPRFGDRRSPDGKLDEKLETVCNYDTLQNICEHGGLILFGHYFDKTGLYSEPIQLEKDTPLAYAVDRISLGIPRERKHLWAYKDGCVFHTSRSFADDLESEIPADILTKYRKRATDQGGMLTLDDAAEFASQITEKQALNAPRDIRHLCPSLYAMFGWRPLRFYASLTSEQRQAAVKNGISYFSLSRNQRILFDKAVDGMIPQSEGSIETMSPESFYVEIKPMDSKIFQNAKLLFSFSGIKPIEHSVMIRVKGDTKQDVKQAESAVSPVAATEPIPEEPRSLKVAAALAQWNYAGRYIKEGQEPKARLRHMEAGEKNRKLLNVGDTLEGARLTNISPDKLAFTYEGSTLVLPIQGAVHLAPYDIKTAADAHGWSARDAILSAQPVVMK